MSWAVLQDEDGGCWRFGALDGKALKYKSLINYCEKLKGNAESNGGLAYEASEGNLRIP